MTAPLSRLFFDISGVGPTSCKNYFRVRLFIYIYFKGLVPVYFESLASLNSTVISLEM